MKLYSIIAAMFATAALGWGDELLTLSRAYDLALQNEPKLGSLALKTESAKEYIEQSRARLYPQVQGNLSWGRYEYEYVASTHLPVKETFSSYSVSATQPLFHPELWRGIDGSKAREAAARYQYLAESQTLGLDVAKAYFNLIRTQRNVELLTSQKEYYESKFRQLQEMLKSGLTNRIDLLESKIRRDKAVSEWLTEQKRVRVATMRLEHLVNTKVESLPAYDFSAIDAAALFSERSVWEEKLSSNPSLKAAVAGEEMALHEAAAREYDHYPKLDLSVNRKETYTQDTLAHRYDNQAILQLSVPIYQGGYTQSKVRETRLLAEAASKERDYTEQETTMRFEELWADHELNLESLSVLRDSEKSAVLFLDSVEKAHKAGLKSIVDVLEAKAKVFEIKRDAVDAEYKLVDNYLGMLDVVGELNSDKIAMLEKMILKGEGEQ